MRRRAFIAGGAASLLAATGRADMRPAFSVIAGDRFRLEGREHRLADILAPSPHALIGAEPFAEAAAGALARILADGVPVMEEVGEADRWGRPFARLWTDGADGENRSVQELLIEAGAARVRPETGDHAFIASLLALEEDARTRRKGLWALDAYAVFPALDAEAAIGRFALVEGVVAASAVAGGRTFLNFGADYREDFTASARSVLARRWAKDGPDLSALEGARVRARGHAAWINGPSIDLAHPMQLEVLAPPETKTPAAETSAPALSENP